MTIIRGKQRKAIYRHIEKNPGATYASVAEALNITTGNASAALSTMHDLGLIYRQRKGHFFAYFVVKDKPAPTPAVDVSALKQELEELRQWKLDAVAATQSLHARIDRQCGQIERLEAWKAEAIIKHPDLDEDPLLPRARKIVADMYRAKPDADEGTLGFADCIENGQNDHLIEVLASLATLRHLSPPGRRNRED